MTAPATFERTYVPDGDPCPVHGEPTRLLRVEGVGLVSQCEACVADFYGWWWECYVNRGEAPARPVAPVRKTVTVEATWEELSAAAGPAPVVTPPAPQLELL